MLDPLSGVAGAAIVRSNAATKLVETVSAGLGNLYEPTRIRRRARAEKCAMVIRAEGEAEVADIARRAAWRVGTIEIRRQQNIEATADLAYDHLPPNASPDPVDPDWIAQFFEGCQDVSNEQMRELWAKLLAGEIVQPGTFSPRLLSILRVMNPRIANTFAAHAALRCVGGVDDQGCIFLPPVAALQNDAGAFAQLRPFDIRYSDTLELIGLGLLAWSPGHAVKLDPGAQVTCGGVRIDWDQDAQLSIGVNVITFTPPGGELASVIQGTPAPEWVKMVRASLNAATQRARLAPELQERLRGVV